MPSSVLASLDVKARRYGSGRDTDSTTITALSRLAGVLSAVGDAGWLSSSDRAVTSSR